MDPCSVCGRKACICDLWMGGTDEEAEGDPGMSKEDWLEIMSDPDYPDDDQEP
jgi:hypothetical protein